MRKMLIGIAVCACLILPSAIYSVSSGSDETMDAISPSVDVAMVHFSTTTGMVEEWPEPLPEPISYPPEGPMPILPHWERPCTLAVYMPEII